MENTTSTTTSAGAQNGAENGAPAVAALGVVVADMARALAFYRRLGLDLPAEADAAPHAEAVLPSGFRVLFDTAETIRSFDPAWRPGSGGPRMSVAVDCGTPARVDALYAELTADGHRGRAEPWDAVWGQRYAIVLDPDGNGVDLYATLR